MPPLVIEVPAASLNDLGAEPNCDGIYLDGLVPAMTALSDPPEDANTWKANGDLTETQVMLGLCGLVHLEILNGGTEQLVFNGGRRALDAPEAIRRLGLDLTAELVREAVAIAWIGQTSDVELNDDQLNKLEQLDSEIAVALESRAFYDRAVAAMKADGVGYLIVDGETSRSESN